MAPLLPPHARPSLVNVARASAALQAPGDSDRIAWERDVLATAAAGGHIGVTSRYIRDHLTAAYDTLPLAPGVSRRWSRQDWANASVGSCPPLEAWPKRQKHWNPGLVSAEFQRSS